MRFFLTGRWLAVIFEKFATRRWGTARSIWDIGLPLSLAVVMGACGTTRSHAMLPDGYLDTPASGALISKITPVMGWALSEDGIESVSIYLDRRYIMEAKTGLSRPDVGQIHPQIPDSGQSGWEADLKLDGVAGGAHTITALIRSKADATMCVSTKVTVR